METSAFEALSHAGALIALTIALAGIGQAPTEQHNDNILLQGNTAGMIGQTGSILDFGPPILDLRSV